MAKQTLGPWFAEANESSEELGEFTIKDADGGYVADVRNPYVDYDMQVDYAAHPDCQIEPTAKLLAAAPEMLEALKLALTFLPIGFAATGRSGAADDRNASLNAARDAVEAAIAKAEGIQN